MILMEKGKLMDLGRKQIKNMNKYMILILKKI